MLLLKVVYLHSTAAELCISMTAAATAVAECYISKITGDFIISMLAAAEFYISKHAAVECKRLRRRRKRRSLLLLLLLNLSWLLFNLYM